MSTLLNESEKEFMQQNIPSASHQAIFKQLPPEDRGVVMNMNGDLKN